MKSSLRYLMLWQKKRNELPINDDPQTDWMEMQSLLDTHLPVNGKKASRFKKIKLLPTLFITFTAAAMVYTAARVVINKAGKHHITYHRGHGHHFSKTSSPVDSLYTDSLIGDVDSTTKQSVETIQPEKTSVAGGTDVTTGTNKNAIKSSALSTNHAEMTVAADKNNILRASASSSAQKNQPIGNQPVSGRQTNGFSTNAANTVLAGNRTSGVKSFSSGLTINEHPSRRGNHHSIKPHGSQASGIANDKAIGKADEQSQPDVADNNNIYQPLQAASIHLNFNNKPGIPLAGLNNSVVKRLPINQSSKNNIKTIKPKPSRTRNSGTSNIDWGVLTGVNSSGSFTPKAQNANFYGSFPVDLYLGLFATYHLNSKWGINVQTQIYSPQTINASYTHANGSKVDSTQSLKITASRKVYNINVPIHIVYNVTDKISFKAGPVIGFPVKQINTNSTLLPAGIHSDSTYYGKSIAILNQTKYEQGINLGFSGGASVKAGRFIFEATYLKSITGYKIVSDWGTYKSNNGTLQFTISFKLNKSK